MLIIVIFHIAKYSMMVSLYCTVVYKYYALPRWHAKLSCEMSSNKQIWILSHCWALKCCNL